MHHNVICTVFECSLAVTTIATLSHQTSPAETCTNTCSGPGCLLPLDTVSRSTLSALDIPRLRSVLHPTVCAEDTCALKLPLYPRSPSREYGWSTVNLVVTSCSMCKKVICTVFECSVAVTTIATLSLQTSPAETCKNTCSGPGCLLPLDIVYR